MTDIQITSIARDETAPGYPVYRITYPHPDTGEPHLHVVPLEAIATRAELLGITDHEEVLDLIIREAHAPDDEVTAVYTDAVTARTNASQAVARDAAPVARDLPESVALNHAVTALDAAPGRGQADRLRSAASRHLVDHGHGAWSAVRQALLEDQAAIDLWGARYVAEALEPVRRALAGTQRREAA
ncbi:hypothetical protein ACFXKD_27860 [Nocardiopsis aegyptia]|uniref:hypothetical protein n=1 Tax=Nocardiopsis aegyptia TaxID=220378 RepID=UPI00366ED662